MQKVTAISLFYAAYFAGLGIMLPYFPLYLAYIGTDPAQVGLIVGLLASTKVIAPPLAGRILDPVMEKRCYVAEFMFLAALAMVLISASERIAILALWVVLFGLAWSAALPLTDSLSVSLAEKWQVDYGRVRVWGSVGFIAATLAGGFIFAAERMRWLPAVMLALLLLGFGAARSFPALPRERERGEEGDCAFSPALKRLLAAGCIMQASHGAYYGFYSLYLQNLDYDALTIGMLWALGVMAEIVLMWGWSGALGRAAPGPVVASCLLLAALRWWGIGASQSLMALALLQLLHAATFAAFHVHAVAWVGRWAPKRSRASAQGWYSAAGFGLGTTLGVMACGWIIEHAGFPAAFFACAFLAAVGSIIALGLPRQRSAKA